MVRPTWSAGLFSGDELLLDANVWIYLEGPPGQPEEFVEKYSALLQEAEAVGCQIVLSDTVLSEFINRCFRIAYGVWQNRSSHSFKAFRSSDAGEQAKKDIATACSSIMNFCSRATRYTGSLEHFREAVSELATGNHDYNDLRIAACCRAENLTLVTHDADFRALSDLTIITANKSALTPA